jgi:hypothetical protein
VKGSDKYVKHQVEHVDPPFIILNGGVGLLELLYVTLLLTPHHTCIVQEIIFISNTFHALKVFMKPITTFEETLEMKDYSANMSSYFKPS